MSDLYVALLETVQNGPSMEIAALISVLRSVEEISQHCWEEAAVSAWVKAHTGN